MTRFAAALLVGIFAVLACVHVYWAAGGRRGHGTAVPSVEGRPLFRPSPLATLVVAVALAGAATVVAGTIGWLGAVGSPVSPRVWRGLAMALSIVFALRAIGDFRYVGFFKTIGGSPFARWDSWLFSPLCLLIAIAAFVVSRSHHAGVTRP